MIKASEIVGILEKDYTKKEMELYKIELKIRKNISERKIEIEYQPSEDTDFIKEVMIELINNGYRVSMNEICNNSGWKSKHYTLVIEW